MDRHGLCAFCRTALLSRPGGKKDGSGDPSYKMRALLMGLCWLTASNAGAQTIHVSPAAVLLDNPEATQQVLVSNANRSTDLTRVASYAIENPKIAAVEADGLVRPITEGKTTLVVRHDKSEVRISVDVSGLKTPTPVSFD